MSGVSSSILRAAPALAVVLAALVPPAHAGDSFTGALADEELAVHRAGELGFEGSDNVVHSAESAQGVGGSSDGHSVSIGGDAPSGESRIADHAFSNSAGITNVTMNTAMNSTVQGIVSMTVIMND